MPDIVIEEKEQFESLPDPVKSAFVEVDGKYVLQREDVTGLKKALEQEIGRRKRVQNELQRFADVDPEKYAELLRVEEERRDKQLIEAGKVEELLAERTQRLKADLEKKLTEAETHIKVRDEKLKRLLIDNEIARLAESAQSAARVRAGALEEVLMHARMTFTLADGDKVVPRDDLRLYGKDGGVMTIAEWLGDLSQRKPYLFEESVGAGTRNTSGGTPPKAPEKKAKDMSAAEKQAFIAEHGFEGWSQKLLKERAEKPKAA